MSYERVIERMTEASERAGRSAGDLTLVAVSKTKSVEEILALYERGHRDFGENRARELVEKASRLPADIRWHFVGALQSNKARLIRPVSHLLHSMDRVSLAGPWLKGIGLAPPVLVQVNVGDEAQKSGVALEDAGRLAGQLLDLGLDVRGLMAIPPIPDNPEESRPYFVRLRRLRESMARQYPSISDLSMGMTDDFEVAIEEGASIIRVGRAIFGARN